MLFVIIGIILAIGIVLLSSLAGMLDTHFAYGTHSGGGTYEEINTAGYGRFTVPQGGGRWLYAVHAECATGASASRVKFTMKEWDGEDIIIGVRDAGSRDPSDFTYMKKPRYMPGGAVLYIYASHATNEALHITVLMSDGQAGQSMESYKGESRGEELTAVTNSVANTWTTTSSWKAPATRGPHAIVGATFFGTTPKIGRLIIPQMPNGFRPPVFSSDTPIAGVEGPTIGRLLEPVPILDNETIYLEALCVGAAAVSGYLEVVAAQPRNGVPGSVTTSGGAGPVISGSGGRTQSLTGLNLARTGARLMMGR